MFNRTDDYLFDGWSSGQSSQLNACLNAGWRTGLTGVTDEHGTNWGRPDFGEPVPRPVRPPGQRLGRRVLQPVVAGAARVSQPPRCD
jgi:hypothetical protein